MSVWTHVCGIIRVDGIPGMSSKFTLKHLTEVMGPIKLWEDEVTREEDVKLPMGSEGSLHYKIIEYSTGLPWVSIAIWGDLRHYDDISVIRKWWKETLDQFDIVRDAVLLASVEGGEEVIMTHEVKEKDNG